MPRCFGCRKSKKVRGKRTYKCKTCKMPKALKKKLKCAHPKKYRQCVRTQERAYMSGPKARAKCRASYCKGHGKR